MEFYGPYEVVKDIAAGPDSTVYLARDRDRAGEALAIKVRRPLDLNPLSPEIHPGIATFRLGVERQAALAGTPGLVRIERSGVDARGAWCVRKFYRHSLRWIIEGRARLALEDFYFLVRSIVDALGELQRASAGPHGNLHPGNVLIQPGATFRQSEVVLTDVASLPADRDVASRSDLRALGLVIYQLVRARPLDQIDGDTAPASWPIPKTDEEWPALFGEQADGWRTLCNTLLEREFDLARTNLQSVARDLEALAPPPNTLVRCGRLVARSAPVSAPAALLVMACLYLHWVPDSKSPPWVQKLARVAGNTRILPREWLDCRSEYFGWFSNFLMAAESAPRLWTNDADLRLILKPIENARGGFLARQNLTFLTLTNAEVPDVRTNLAAWESILILANETRRKLEGWPVRTKLGAAAKQFRGRQWNGPAAELAARAKAIRFDTNPDWRIVIGNVLEADAGRIEVENLWAGVEGTAQRIQKNFPDLVEISTFLTTVRFTSEETDLQKAGNRLRKQHQLADDAWNFATEVWRGLPPSFQATNLPPKGLAEKLWEPWKEKVRDAWLRHQQTPEIVAAIKVFKARRFLDCPMLEKEWLARVDRLATDPDARNSLSNILEHLHVFFVKLTNFLPALEFPMPATNDKIVSMVRRMDQERRDQALFNALNGMTNHWQGEVPPSDSDETTMWADPLVQGVRDSFKDWQGAIKEFAAQAPDIPKLLETGDHVEALRLWRRWKGGPLLGDLQRERDLQIMFEPLRELEEIADRPDLGPDALVARVLNATRETPLAVLWAAWKRLGAVSAAWPTDATQMQSEARMQRALQERIGRLDDTAAGPRAGLQKQLEETAVDLLLAGFLVLTNDRSRAQARQMIESEGLAGIIGGRVPPEAQFNSQLLDLRLTNLVSQNSNTVSELHADFVRRVGEWKLADRIAGFSNIAALRFTNGTPVSEVPATTLEARARWNRIDGEGEVTFTWQTHQLRFFLVPVPDAKPVYLCETEVPVGLFADWAEKVVGVTNLYANFEWLKTPRNWLRGGIQTWEAGGRKRPIVVSTSWQTRDAANLFFGTNRLEFTTVSPPNASHPVNYVPAGVARFLAESMGFRLPTRAEWLQAYLSQPDHPANLRDATWREQQQYVGQIAKINSSTLPVLPWPDQDTFAPRGSNVPLYQNARASKINDTVLWFAPVQETNAPGESASSSRFVHLVGNVAEYVCEMTPEKPSYFVVGGSALSDPTLSVTNPYPLRITDDWVKGYSDVGFRLALEGEESPVQKFQTLIRKIRYLARSH